MSNLKKSKTINCKSRLTSDIFGLIFYLVSFCFLPLFWFLVDFWVFKVTIILCGLVCIVNVVANITEIKKISRLLRQGIYEYTVGDGENNEPRNSK